MVVGGAREGVGDGSSVCALCPRKGQRRLEQREARSAGEASRGSSRTVGTGGEMAVASIGEGKSRRVIAPGAVKHHARGLGRRIHWRLSARGENQTGDGVGPTCRLHKANEERRARFQSTKILKD